MADYYILSYEKITIIFHMEVYSYNEIHHLEAILTRPIIVCVSTKKII